MSSQRVPLHKKRLPGAAMIDAETSVRRLYDCFEQNINRGAIRPLVDEFFTDEALVTGHLAPLVRGKADICEFFTKIHAVHEQIRIEMIHTQRGGDDVIYSLANTLSIVRETQSAAALKSLCVFRNTAYGLRCDVDFFALGSI
jgi:ketosteroid isomerase-like protein